MRRLPALALVAAVACTDAAAPAPAAPRSGFVAVASNVRLHYLDFGGTGQPLVLLAGNSNSAHVFESFAPRLTDRFRVIALTRRGFGASSQPADGYDTRTLAEDVRIALDSLGLARVHLVGHSLAGDEMTRLAGDHPDRVARLVYLDAGYDRVAIRDLFVAHPPPPPPALTAADVGSRAGFARYLERVKGVRLPDAELGATFRFAGDGSVLAEVTPPEVYVAIVAGVESPDYARVSAPALAIYAVDTTAAYLAPWLTAGAPGWAEAEALWTTVFQPFYAAERARFAREVPGGAVLELDGANHYVFLSDPDRVAAAIRAFLEAP